MMTNERTEGITGSSMPAGVRPRLIDHLTIPFTVVIALFLIKVFSPISQDPDLWWHLKTGEYIVRNWTLPYVDIFSHTAAGRDWVLHEWLTEVVFYGITRLAGLHGLWGFVAALYAATFLLLYRITGKLLGDETRALLVALAFFAPVVAFASPRPQSFTYLLFAVYLSILVEWKYDDVTSRLPLLPVLMVFWVNLHGAAIVGVVLLVLFLSCETLSFQFGRSRAPEHAARLKRLTLWTGATVLATCVNPRFFEYLLYPVYVTNLTATAFIAEWKSPDFHMLYFRYVLVLFLAFFAAVACSRKRPGISEFCVPAFFIAAGFSSVRHVPLACIAAIPFFAIAFREIKLQVPVSIPGMSFVRRTGATRQLDERWVPYLNLALLASVVAALIVWSPGAKNVDYAVPAGAADYVRDHGIRGTLFNEYGEGGYLIYRLSPEKVFIDGRADMYGDEFFKEYLTIVAGEADWEEKFDRYGVDYAILKKNTPLRQLLLRGKGFKVVYDDTRYSVLVRDIPKFSHLTDLRKGLSAVGSR